MLSDAKERARKLALPFDIALEDVCIPTHCPLLGVELCVTNSRTSGRANSPSLDRIDPTKGYVRGNVWVVSFRANAIKQDASPEELERIATALKLRLRCQAWPLVG